MGRVMTLSSVKESKIQNKTFSQKILLLLYDVPCNPFSAIFKFAMCQSRPIYLLELLM